MRNYYLLIPYNHGIWHYAWAPLNKTGTLQLLLNQRIRSINAHSKIYIILAKLSSMVYNMKKVIPSYKP